MAPCRGGVDDGQDAELIVHQYGHRWRTRRSGRRADEGGAMGEAFGDFLAGSF